MKININSKYNPFGNAEDLPPPPFYPDCYYWVRQLLWWWRNPLHNFTFHWIGIHDYVVERVDSLWNPNGGFRFSKVCTKYFCLPFMSYRGERWEWYAGWRPNGGFGFPWPRKAKAKQPGE